MLGWVALDKELVIGFAGLYEEENRIIKLAHLLVDENYRGYHLGSLLETKREDYYQKIESGIILASCVDTPPQSMFLKKKHGFHFLGARVNYRPSPLHRGHSILMGKYNRDIKQEYLETPSDVTRKIIYSRCLSLECTRVFVKKKATQQGAYAILTDDKLGRKTARFQNNKNSKCFSLLDAIENLKDGHLPYVSITVNAFQEGFSKADSILIENGFYPVIFLPNYNSDVDLLEYQYFGIAEKQEYESLIEKLKELQVYEDRIGVCAL